MRHSSLGIETNFRSFCAFLSTFEKPNVVGICITVPEFQNRNIYLSSFDTEVIRQRYGGESGHAIYSFYTKKTMSYFALDSQTRAG